MPKLTGHCLCGQVRYRIDLDDVAEPLTVCHCRQCGRWTGGVAPFLSCRATELTVTGEVRWFQSSPDVKRGFCQTCGGSLFWQAEPGSRIHVTAGTLDPPTGLTVGEHIWIASKADWDEIADTALKRPGD